MSTSEQLHKKSQKKKNRIVLITMSFIWHKDLITYYNQQCPAADLPQHVQYSVQSWTLCPHHVHWPPHLCHQCWLSSVSVGGRGSSMGLSVSSSVSISQLCSAPGCSTRRRRRRRMTPQLRWLSRLARGTTAEGQAPLLAMSVLACDKREDDR